MTSVLLGPDGKPASNYAERKTGRPKNPKPLVGEISAGWMDAETSYLRLPGGGQLYFDTSQLTLGDFRRMSEHPQIASSLYALSFMLHQMEWELVDSSDRIRKHCDENLRAVWTQLVRSMGSSFTFGFSPNATQWENQTGSSRIWLNKIKDLVPEECTVNWKYVDGATIPGSDGVTKPKIPVFDGIKQFGRHTIPVTNCVTPETKILCADMQWRSAGSLMPGDEIIAFDENDEARGRKYRKAEIVVNNPGIKNCVIVSTGNSTITLSEDHPFLVRKMPYLTGDKSTSKYREYWDWIDAKDLKPGDRVAWFSAPWKAESSSGQGYLAGIYDGEAHLAINHGLLHFYQNKGPVLDRVKQELTERGFEFLETTDRKSDNCTQLTILGGRREVMRFLGVICPERWDYDTTEVLWNGCSIKIEKSVDLDVVKSVEKIGPQQIASIQTSSGTFITGGYLTHNSYWYPLLMKNGDYRGTRILRAAFQPWYFSNLIKLFANQYYERFGSPLPIGRAPYDEDINIGTNDAPNMQPGNKVMAQIIKALRNRSAVVLPNQRSQDGLNGTKTFDYELQYLECVDAETQILTRTGWKYYHEVESNDDTLTLNNKTGLSEWQPIKKMNVHDGQVGRKLLYMEGKSHSSLTTLGHRWPVLFKSYQKQNGKEYRSEYRRFRESRDLTQRDFIPLCAQRADHASVAKYDDNFVELVAWYWTEGYTYNTGNYVSITQKRFPERIRACLNNLYGPPVEKFTRYKWNDDGPTVPQWRENGKSSDEDTRQFFLNYVIVQDLKAVAPDKIVTYDFILSLTKSQLALYIDASMAADGNQNSRQSFLMQKNRQMAERFEFACIQSGIATSLYWVKEDPRWKNDTGMWVVSMRRSTQMNPVTAAKAKNGVFSIREVEYDGIVWCPTTDNATWLARRNGKVYFTGNSQMRGAEFERMLQRYDEEMSLSLFTPLLLLKTAEGGGYNQGIGHTQVFLWFLNALAGDMAEYINKYILAPMARYNFGANVEPPKIRFRKMGTAQQETLRAIVQALLQQNKIKVDVAELGAHIGLEIEEVKEITKPLDEPEIDDLDPNAPEKDPRSGRPERLKNDDKPSVSNPKAVTKQITARVGQQIVKAFANKSYGKDWTPSLGYRRQLVEALEASGHNDAEGSARWFEETVTALASDVVQNTEFSGDARGLTAEFDKIVNVVLESVMQNG